ncbi:Rpn family recombination-promoting nuclease/putative transposase [Niabella sp.]|uniref:Rpn family recombination-promoting nuclease/putative transposase n=1 Tax=Niabella sp. TaxID=1962976 RepID=UPI002617EF72|nr:Rpn family recombination-promoting nuclease/putative transposase [Niabella sp.]
MKNTQENIGPSMGRYIDPLTDFGFKKIFGSEPNKDLLIAFLNELFKGRKVIRDLVYNPQEKDGPVKEYRKAIFDLTCSGADGETFIIEVQRAHQQFFADRALFYTASKLYEQAPKGRKEWNFYLKEVYLIAVMDFCLEGTPPGNYLYRVRLAEETSGQTFYNKLGFILIELPNFKLDEQDIKTDLERWLYVLRNMGRLQKIPVILHKKIFQKLFQIAEVANLKKEDYMLYEKDLLDKWTEYAVLKTAEDKGVEKGAEQKAREFVKNLIVKFEFSDEQAANAAEVSVDVVKKIRASLRKKK